MNRRLPLAAIIWAPIGGCGPSPDAPLPPESDLYAYSVAVAERARAMADWSPAKALYNVGKVHQRFGLDEKALEIFKSALDIDPNLGDAYRSTGFILSQRKDRMAQAIEAYQQSLRCEPGASGTLTRIGLVFTHMGKLDDAVRALDEEIRAGTANEDTHYDRGQALALQGKHADAIASFREALKLAPSLRSAWYAMAQSARALGKKEEAEEADGKFRELKKQEDEQAAARGSPADSQEEHRRHASQTWMDSAALFVEGANQALADPSRHDALRKEFLRAIGEALRLGPGELEPRRALIEYHRGRKDFASAARACEEALKALPREATLAPEAYAVAGQILEAYKGSDTPGEVASLALRLLDLAGAARPEFADPHREAAKILLFRMAPTPEKLSAALRQALEAARLEPSEMNYDILALAWFRNGHPDRARQALEEGIQHHPESEQLKQRLQRFLEQGSQGDGQSPR